MADTGPLLHLAEAQLSHLLRLTGDLYVPPLVIAELTFHMPAWQTPTWIHVEPLTASHSMESTSWQRAGLLDSGEADAIALAKQVAADWLLTDDAAARLFATEFGLEVHGSLGIVLWSVAVGHLNHNEADLALNQLAKSSLWISAKILAEAQSVLSEMN